MIDTILLNSYDDLVRLVWGGHYQRNSHHLSLENEVQKTGIVLTRENEGKRKFNLSIFKSWTTADTWPDNLTLGVNFLM